MKTFIITLRSAVIALACVCLLGTPAFAQAPTFLRADSALFGVAPGQFARLNVVHVGDVAAPPIQVDMMLINSAGSVVARGSGKALFPGQSTFLDFIAPTRERIELRALVTLISGDLNFLKANVEIIDAGTERTDLIVRMDKTEL